MPILVEPKSNNLAPQLQCTTTFGFICARQLICNKNIYIFFIHVFTLLCIIILVFTLLSIIIHTLHSSSSMCSHYSSYVIKKYFFYCVAYLYYYLSRFTYFGSSFFWFKNAPTPRDSVKFCSRGSNEPPHLKIKILYMYI